MWTMLRVISANYNKNTVLLHELCDDGTLSAGIRLPYMDLRGSGITSDMFVYHDELYVLTIPHDLMMFSITRIISPSEIYRVASYSNYHNNPNLDTTWIKRDKCAAQFANFGVKMHGSLLYIWQYTHIVVLDIATMLIVRYIPFLLDGCLFTLVGGHVYIVCSADITYSDVPGVTYVHMPPGTDRSGHGQDIYVSRDDEKIRFRTYTGKCYRVDDAHTRPACIAEIAADALDRHGYVDVVDGIAAKTSSMQHRRGIVRVMSTADGSEYDLPLPDENACYVLWPLPI